MLNIFPLEYEIEYRKTLAAIKLVHSNQTTLRLNVDHSHNYPTRFAKNKISIPSSSSSHHGLKGLRNSFISIYNSIPKHIIDLRLVSNYSLKNKLKEYLWIGLEST